MLRQLKRHSLWIAVLLALMVVWGLYFWASLSQEKRLLDVNSRELTELNNVVTEHARAMLSSIESDFRTFDQILHWQTAVDPLTDRHIAALIDEADRASDGLFRIALVTSDGLLFRPTVGGDRPATDVRDQPAFAAALVASPTTMVIGLPARDPVTHSWQIPVSWRLAVPVGRVTMIAAFIDLTRLVGIHDAFRIKPEGTIDLIGLDGVMLSRAPFDANFVGQNFRNIPLFQSEIGQKSHGSFLSTGKATDGVSRIISYQALDEYHLVVMVTRGIDATLADLRQRRIQISGILAVMSAIFIVIAVAYSRSLSALASARDELRVLATVDDLTGALNRRALFRRAEQEFERAKRFGRSLAVLMLDLDHFKKLNDGHGHAMGDLALQLNGNLWRSQLRGPDLLARIGGEEFCILLVETSQDEAALVAERLRRATEANSFGSEDAERIAVTVSIGWTWIGPADKTWPDVLARADRALYDAKHNGRNQVRLLPPEDLPAGISPSL